jgi:hypothetical protein
VRSQWARRRSSGSATMYLAAYLAASATVRRVPPCRETHPRAPLSHGGAFWMDPLSRASSLGRCHLNARPCCVLPHS